MRGSLTHKSFLMPPVLIMLAADRISKPFMCHTVLKGGLAALGFMLLTESHSTWHLWNIALAHSSTKSGHPVLKPQHLRAYVTQYLKYAANGLWRSRERAL